MRLLPATFITWSFHHLGVTIGRRWYKPDYIINELNINSAIAYPAHREVVPLSGGGQTYTVQGYCYTGGGRKIIRVELSTDGGKTWTLTTIKRPETPTEYGRSAPPPCDIERGERRARIASQVTPLRQVLVLGILGAGDRAG